jgi:hypothetical protein
VSAANRRAARVRNRRIRHKCFPVTGMLFIPYSLTRECVSLQIAAKIIMKSEFFTKPRSVCENLIFQARCSSRADRAWHLPISSAPEGVKNRRHRKRRV